jgi:hypothetical protein
MAGHRTGKACLEAAGGKLAAGLQMGRRIGGMIFISVPLQVNKIFQK